VECEKCVSLSEWRRAGRVGSWPDADNKPVCTVSEDGRDYIQKIFEEKRRMKGCSRVENDRVGSSQRGRRNARGKYASKVGRDKV